jgi:hypothetical protein
MIRVTCEAVLTPCGSHAGEPLARPLVGLHDAIANHLSSLVIYKQRRPNSK